MDGPRRGPSGGPGLAGERSRRPRLRGRSFALGRCTWSRALSAGQDKVWIWSSRPHPLTSAFVPERSAEGHEGRARGGVLPPLSFLPPRTPCPLTSASRSLSGARRVGVGAASRAASSLPPSSSTSSLLPFLPPLLSSPTSSALPSATAPTSFPAPPPSPLSPLPRLPVPPSLPFPPFSPLLRPLFHCCCSSLPPPHPSALSRSLPFPPLPPPRPPVSWSASSPFLFRFSPFSPPSPAPPPTSSPAPSPFWLKPGRGNPEWHGWGSWPTAVRCPRSVAAEAFFLLVANPASVGARRSAK